MGVIRTEKKGLGGERRKKGKKERQAKMREGEGEDGKTSPDLGPDTGTSISINISISTNIRREGIEAVVGAVVGVGVEVGAAQRGGLINVEIDEVTAEIEAKGVIEVTTISTRNRKDGIMTLMMIEMNDGVEVTGENEVEVEVEVEVVVTLTMMWLVRMRMDLGPFMNVCESKRRTKVWLWEETMLGNQHPTRDLCL